MKKRIFYLILILFLFLSCGKTKTSQTEKYPDFTKNIIDVSEKIIPIKTEVLLGSGDITNIGSCFLFNDWYGDEDKGFVFFDKKNFHHIGYGGKKGQGPGEHIKFKNVRIIPNEQEPNSFFAFDYSLLCLYKYRIDSLLKDKNYLPNKVLQRKISEVLGNVVQLNDSIFLGMSLYATSHSSFVQRIVKFNTKKEKTELFGYQNPKIQKLGKANTHSNFAMSLKNGIYVQAFHYQDLITFCNREGNLICNVYGQYWKKDKKNFDFYGECQISSKYVFAEYIGRLGLVIDKHKRPRGAFPKKIQIFDLEGNYIKTLDFKEEFRSFCVDEDNNRIIVSFLDRDEPLGYLDLNGILE